MNLKSKLRTAAALAVACSVLFGGVVMAFMLAYKEADGDPHWTVKIGCAWATAWMLAFLVITRFVNDFIEYRRSR